MNINFDDPKLTAFALDELPAAERERMEKAVAASPEAQAEVAEIQALGALVRADFRRDLQQAAEKPRSIVALLEEGNFWTQWHWVSLATAAVLAVGAVVAAVMLSEGWNPSLVAEKERASRREDKGVQMEADVAEPDLRADTAAQSASQVYAAVSAPTAWQRGGENVFAPAAANPVSSFPVQVDTAGYAKVRSSLRYGSRPPKEAVQIEQMINYFDYDYPQPEGDRPFSINVDAATCPWQPGHELVRIGLRGREIANENRAPSNLVFLLDVSGSMHSSDRLPLVKRAMRLLIDRLTENDRVAIVVYAGASGVALPPTPGDRKEEIVRGLEQLEADALTDGVEGLELAYRIAAENFIKGGANRVVVATDGELNVGVPSRRELVKLARKNARAGVGLTMLRVGDDAAQSTAMQSVAADVGGSYAFLDSVQSARKTMLAQINATLVTIASDVDVQVAFNPARVASYRLIGYENGMLRSEGSSRDEGAADDIVAGHTITALYEIVPAAPPPPAGTTADRLVTVTLRHEQPGAATDVVTEHSLDAHVVDWAQAPADFRFAAAVAEFGMILRDSPHKGNGTLAGVLETAESAKGADPAGYRAGFVELVRQAQALAL